MFFYVSLASITEGSLFITKISIFKGGSAAWSQGVYRMSLGRKSSSSHQRIKRCNGDDSNILFVAGLIKPSVSS